MSADTVSGYRFRPQDLAVGARTPGIAIFMRVRNGADFLEAAIRSHADAVDEIVAVYNQCEDDSPQILARLAAELGGKLRVIHYLDKVYPPGSPGHARTAADDPASFVNMSNFALSRTTRTVAMKLDDDHLAIGNRFAALAGRIRARGCRLPDTWCFSGINLARDETGRTGVPRREPLVGAGDHFLFEVSEQTVFEHDRRFEDFRHPGRRLFQDLTYWHLKYLKAGMGFANYELDGERNARFERKKERILADRSVMTLDELRATAPRRTALTTRLPLPEKTRLKEARWQAVRNNLPTGDDLQADLRRLEIWSTGR